MSNTNQNNPNKKTVNTEEQNRVVNPTEKDPRQETGNRENTSSKEEPLQNKKDNKNPRETDNPDGGSEVERPHRIEGDDAGSIERKIPNM